MAKSLEIHCDLCGATIPQNDHRQLDLLRDIYPGKDLCPACDARIEGSQILAKEAIFTKELPQDLLAAWLALYQD